MAEGLKIWSVYVLRDPRNNAIRYVGVTTRELAKRLAGHIQKLHDTPKCAWIRDLIACDLRPTIEAVDSGSGDWEAAEKSWIQRCKDDGCSLTNSTIGGHGTAGYQYTPEVRAKMAAALKGKGKGKKHSPERVAKSAAAHRALNRKVTESGKAALSKAHKGKTISEEHRKRISEYMRGRSVSEETRAKLSATSKGRSKSPEQRAKLSAANKGKRLSQETRAKMVQAWDRRKRDRTDFPEMSRPGRKNRPGQKVSPETREKLRAVWANRKKARSSFPEMSRGKFVGRNISKRKAGD